MKTPLQEGYKDSMGLKSVDRQVVPPVSLHLCGPCSTCPGGGQFYLCLSFDNRYCMFCHLKFKSSYAFIPSLVYSLDKDYKNTVK